MIERMLFSIDIEVNGPRMSKNGILTIGYCVGKLDGTKILQKWISVDLEDRVFDPACMVFFDTFPDILDELRHDPKPIKEALHEFLTDLRTFQRQYDVFIISDYPTFDIGWLNYYLSHYLDEYPLEYILGDPKRYRPVYGTDDHVRGVVKMDYTTEWVSDSVVREQLNFTLPKEIQATHNPMDDATYTFYQHVSVLKAISEV